MQPLSKVRSGADVSFGSDSIMAMRPNIAIKIAECFAKWAEIESSLGLFLALLLEADQKSILGMYLAIDSRAAQLRMLTGAAKAKLPEQHFKVFEAIIVGFIKPAAKERDKFAHWCWGFSHQLPDDLLLIAPEDKLALHVDVLSPPKPLAADKSLIFVVTERFVDETLKRSAIAHDFFLRLISTIWSNNPPEARAQYLARLSSEPPILKVLGRLQNQGKSPKSQQSTPPPAQNGGA